MIDFKLADIKLESSEGYLLKLGKIRRRVSKFFTFFVTMRFKIYADISNVFIPTRKEITFP